MTRTIKTLTTDLLNQCRKVPSSPKTRRKRRSYSPQKFDYGNRCGHNLQKFRVCNLPPNLPDLLKIAYGKLCNTLVSAKKTKQMFGVSIRSEAREAMLGVFSVLFQYLDLGTFKVGVYNRKIGQLKPLDQAWIAKQTGFLSLSRAESAFEVIHGLGLMTTEQNRYQVALGEFRSRGATRQVTMKLFQLLDISKKFIAKARKISQKVKEKAIKVYHHLAPWRGRKGHRRSQSSIDFRHQPLFKKK